MPGQKVIDRAVAGSVPDGLLIGRLEIVEGMERARGE